MNVLGTVVRLQAKTIIAITNGKRVKAAEIVSVLAKKVKIKQKRVII